MKEIVLSLNNDTVHKMALFPPEAEGENGRRCAIGVRFTQKFRVREYPDGECVRDENGNYIHELDPSHCKLAIYPRLYGRCATWEELLVALYWGEGGTFGEQLESWAQEAHRAREYPWRVQKERFSGYTEYRIRESDDETARLFGLAGRIVSRFRITPNDKVNEGVPLELSLADWYVFLYTIPHRPWAELEERYKETPPREIFPIKAEWHAPGAEPWEEGTTAPDEEPAQEEGEGKGKEEGDYAIKETHENGVVTRVVRCRDAETFKESLCALLRQKKHSDADSGEE